MAQTQIGGGTCNSSSLNGVYALTLTGRQATAAGTPAVLQGNGTATFDGLNKVTIAVTANRLQALGTALTWSGTYSTQSNCAGVVTITTGASTTLNLVIYGQGNSFLLTGTDGTYNYTGSGNNAPKTTCSAGQLSGVYTFNAGGSVVSSGAVTAVAQSAGLLQFDGQSGVKANITLYSTGAASSTITLTGTYTISAGCLATATLTDTNSNSYAMSMSATNSNATSTRDLTVTFAQASKLLLTGSAHAVYGQPTPSATNHGPGYNRAIREFAARMPRNEAKEAQA